MREQSENQASTPALMPTEKQKEDITMADMSYLKDMPIAILGAGAVGKTMAADCALDGKEVRLWDQPRFAKINFTNIEKTGITLSGSAISAISARVR
jgi:lactate dehydrogenase-like 2-hydroxyacid dehydrogenase